MMAASEQPDEAILSEIRTIGLRREVEEIAGQPLNGYESPETPPFVAEQFWENVLAFESAPWTTNFDQIREAGVELPAPEDVPDALMESVLWWAIRSLADVGVYVEDTDHLSDRELYEWLWHKGLREHTNALPRSPNASWHTSPIGSGSAEDMLIYHRYFASARMRRMWMKDFPDYKMPKREKPPYDRDRRLPKWEIPEMQIPDDLE